MVSANPVSFWVSRKWFSGRSCRDRAVGRGDGAGQREEGELENTFLL